MRLLHFARNDGLLKTNLFHAWNGMSSVKENLLKVRERIERAAQKAGRDPKEIKLVAVSKTVELDRIKEAIEKVCLLALHRPPSVE
jgi:hypothetical protein